MIVRNAAKEGAGTVQRGGCGHAAHQVAVDGNPQDWAAGACVVCPGHSVCLWGIVLCVNGVLHPIVVPCALCNMCTYLTNASIRVILQQTLQLLPNSRVP